MANPHRRFFPQPVAGCPEFDLLPFRAALHDQQGLVLPVLQEER